MVGIKSSKKGIFLTLISLSIVVALALVFAPFDVNLKKDIPVINARVSNLNDFVLDLENVYLERTLQSSSTKTIISLINYMESKNEFLTDFEANFTEVLLYGTIGGTDIEEITGLAIMKDNTYLNWTNKIKNISENTLNVNTNISVNGIYIYQISPWFINVDANVSFSVSSETASWDKNVTIQTQLDIQNFEDPYYLVNTAGSYIKKINKSNVPFDQWNNSNVEAHIKHGTYTHFEQSKAPDFIMRFTNTSLSSSCCGIESIVNPNKLSNPDQNESYADYLFFNHTYQDRCNELFLITAPEIEPQFPYLRFEFEHLALYNLTDLGDYEECY